MKVSDIHKWLDTIIDKNSVSAQNGGCPPLLPEEKDIFLNQALLDIISQKVGTFAGVPFEGSPKRVSDIQKLIKADYDLPITSKSSNVLTLESFTGDRKRFIPLDLLISATTPSGHEIKEICSLSNRKIAAQYMRTESNQPWIESPIYYLEDDNIKIVVDPFEYENAVVKVTVTYIKYPTVINSSNFSTDITDVSDVLMYEAINRAAVLILENVESQRTPGKLQLNQLSEQL